MKKLILLLTFLLYTTISFANTSPSIVFVQHLTDNIITNVLTSSDTPAKKEKRFNEYFLNALDTKNIGRFVLGSYARTASDSDAESFTNAFTTMALKSWADKFNLYTGQKLTFQGERPAEGKNQIYVDSLIMDKPNPVAVIWRLKEKNGEFKIMDIIVEGVSMALTYRNEYTAFLKDHTLPELTAKLKSQADSFKASKK